MKKVIFLALSVLFSVSISSAKILTYNKLEQINLRDMGIPTDERSTNVLIASGKAVYGATSGDTCHVFRFDPQTGKLLVLASIDGPNTVLKGMVLDDDTIYVGTMLTKRQLWWEGRRRGGTYEQEDANLYQIDTTWNTGHLYRIKGVKSDNPVLEDLGIPVEGQGIHTMAMDSNRGLIYGLTYPAGRFFIYDTRDNTGEVITFGTAYTYVSNHMVNFAEVEKDLTDFTPGEGEFNNKIVAKAMHVMPDGTVFTSGWDGRIIRYDPGIANPQDRFTAVGSIPTVPGRQYWNRIDEIVENDGKLYIGSSDGYIFQFDPATRDIKNYGKPVRAIEVMGLAFSTVDGDLYGINGGDLDGVSRFWYFDNKEKTFEVDYPAVKAFRKRPMGDIVCTEDGTIGRNRPCGRSLGAHSG